MVKRLDFQRCKWLWVVNKRVRVFLLFLTFYDSERKRRFRSSTLVKRKIGILLYWTRTCIYILCISCIRTGENSWVRISFEFFLFLFCFSQSLPTFFLRRRILALPVVKLQNDSLEIVSSSEEVRSKTFSFMFHLFA